MTTLNLIENLQQLAIYAFYPLCAVLLYYSYELDHKHNKSVRKKYEKTLKVFSKSGWLERIQYLSSELEIPESEVLKKAVELYEQAYEEGFAQGSATRPNAHTPHLSKSNQTK